MSTNNKLQQALTSSNKLLSSNSSNTTKRRSNNNSRSADVSILFFADGNIPPRNFTNKFATLFDSPAIAKSIALYVICIKKKGRKERKAE